MAVHAYAAQQAGSTLEPFDYEAGALAPFEVDIRVTHCGVCHSDIHLIDGDWGNRFPVIAGHEIVGIIEAVGSQVTDVALGDRVGVGWQAGSCMTCEWCISGQDNLCPNSVATCQNRFGGFADHVRADSRFTHILPDLLDSEKAAPLLCAGITVYSPLKHFGVTPASRVGVIGIGGLGHLGLQFASAFGCEVTAFSTSPAKAEEARSFGADRFISTTDADALKGAARSLDFILVTVNVQLDWRRYLRILRPNGMLCIVGAIPGDMAIPAAALLDGQKSIRGGEIGSRAAMREMLQFAARHNITAQTEAVPMSEINHAIERVRQNQARYRMVLLNNG